MLRQPLKKVSRSNSTPVEQSPESKQPHSSDAEPELLELKTLTDLEHEWKSKVHERLLQMIDLSLIDTLGKDKARTEIEEICLRILEEESAPVNFSQRQVIVRSIQDDVLGLGPLELLLKDSTISDILVNGAKNVYVERRGKLYRTAVAFNDNRHLLNVIDRIVSAVGRRIDESSPMVDARLEDGSRVNAIIPPLALDGPSLSIRRFAVDLFTVEDLVELGTLTDSAAKVLDAVVKSRLNVLISGGTGSGKTTLLNVASGFIPEDERIITIEDSAELQLRQPHVVRLETRPANIEGRGEISQRDLVKNSLRMRPERIVIGEVRGSEALDMLQAMNTGHDGSITTVHANTPRDALGRIETMVTMSGVAFPIRTLRAQISSAINIVIQIERSEDGRRRLTSIQEIDGMEGDVITMSELFTFRRDRMDENKNVVGELVPTGVVPKFHRKLAGKGIDLPIEMFEHSWDQNGS
ncbi:MAG: CpaF family protein [Pseudomonadales bacterium]|nr:CpaF family protein [Pseudomonadales bacterium]